MRRRRKGRMLFRARVWADNVGFPNPFARDPGAASINGQASPDCSKISGMESKKPLKVEYY